MRWSSLEVGLWARVEVVRSRRVRASFGVVQGMLARRRGLSGLLGMEEIMPFLWRYFLLKADTLIRLLEAREEGRRALRDVTRFSRCPLRRKKAMRMIP